MKDTLIETGVDKLVNLVNRKKKISMNHAAKELGVGLPVIEEWADFLEEEGIISLDYKLATTYLIERKLSKKEVQKKAKEFVGKKDAFVRKVETTVAHIERETSGFNDIKDHFNKLKTDLSGELGHIKGELKELENYERLKKEIDKQMLNQEQDFKKKMIKVDKQIMGEKRKYQSIVNDVNAERVKLEEERNIALDLETQEQEIREKLDSFTFTLEKLRKNVKLEDNMTHETEKHLANFKKLSDDVKGDIDSKKGLIQKLGDEQKKQETRIISLQKSVMEKVKEKRKHIEEEVAYGTHLSERFDKFFNHKNDIEKALNKIEKDKMELKDEMEGLIKKAKAFDLASKSSNVKSHIKELSGKFKELESKKSRFEKELSHLSSLFHTK